MKKSRVTSGVYWVEAPRSGLRILCGTPADAVKHLMRRGLIHKVERDGSQWETGPNAIILSDVSIQNGDFANLSEFPVLQMFYRQGMIIPGHPNNTGVKPKIIGARDQIEAQREYIFRGTYGLVSFEELSAAGLDDATASEYMRIKETFAFGTIRRPEELIDFIVVDEEPVEIAPGVEIERVALNTYRIADGDDSVKISLNLPPGEQYEPPYVLGQHKIKEEYFSVVHTGEGDGWDSTRPCMASILVFQGRIYLIDAGPSVMHTLNSVGMSVNQIDGIFHTHAHDDHFAGLTSLVRADHRLPYFAAPMVRASVMKKLSALMSFPEEQFERYFVSRDLVPDTWNMIEGLEAMPVFSPHPVETTVMFFRALWSDGYKTYAHFADICSMEQLDRLLVGGNEVSRTILDRVRHNYSIPVDIKKLDIGGGMIHGVAEDFCDDQSARIVLSHTSAPLTLREKEIGADTSFGMADVLIHSASKQPEASIRHLLRQNYPAVPDHDIALLANCQTRTLSIGSILIKRDRHVDAIYLLTNGLAETVESETNTHNIVTAGSMIGERNCLLGEISRRTYRAASFIRVLEIPRDLYRSFIERNGLEETMRDYLERKYFLEGTYLFGDRISGATRNAIIHEMEERTSPRGERVVPEDSILAVAEGAIEVHCGDQHVYTARTSDVVGGVRLSAGDHSQITYYAHEESRYYLIPCTVVEEIPIVRWKLLEQINRTMRSCIAAY